jgi:hypothetical protein
MRFHRLGGHSLCQPKFGRAGHRALEFRFFSFGCRAGRP